ncbi:MAG TPA: YbaB/EbfC family nucleoid-associated protein [Candidatus Limnocylindria bacterium]|jgi:DNA-binding YbaB/EbfC family protein|nr:YbaB/EbfC family nucleoid-associated protein [Candidatus Limnocylindria bacterium]
MNQAQMMQQIRKMQQEMARVQEELANTVIDGSAASGAVTVSISGEFQVKKVAIKPEVVDPEDVETLEDLLVVALNDALGKVQELSSRKMGALTGGMKIPGLM